MTPEFFPHIFIGVHTLNLTKAKQKLKHQFQVQFVAILVPFLTLLVPDLKNPIKN
jgi:hypothetical protein